MEVASDMIADSRKPTAIRIRVNAVNTGRATRTSGGDMPGGISRTRRRVISSESISSSDPNVGDEQKPEAGSPRERGLRSSPMVLLRGYTVAIRILSTNTRGSGVTRRRR